MKPEYWTPKHDIIDCYLGLSYRAAGLPMPGKEFWTGTIKAWAWSLAEIPAHRLRECIQYADRMERKTKALQPHQVVAAWRYLAASNPSPATEAKIDPADLADLSDVRRVFNELVERTKVREVKK